MTRVTDTLGSIMLTAIVALVVIDQTFAETAIPHVTQAFLVLSFIGLFLSLSIMILMRPYGWSEWGEVAKVSAFTAVIARAFFNRFTDIEVSPLHDLIFYTVCTALILFFAGVMIWTWGGFVLHKVRRNRRLNMYIGGGLLLLILVIILLVWVF